MSIIWIGGNETTTISFRDGLLWNLPIIEIPSLDTLIRFTFSIWFSFSQTAFHNSNA